MEVILLHWHLEFLRSIRLWLLMVGTAFLVHPLLPALLCLTYPLPLPVLWANLLPSKLLALESLSHGQFLREPNLKQGYLIRLSEMWVWNMRERIGKYIDSKPNSSFIFILCNIQHNSPSTVDNSWMD